MASQFDPSAFIQAESEQLSQTLASNSEGHQAPLKMLRTAEIRHFRASAEPALARIATIAAVGAEKLPWSNDLENWASKSCPDFIAPNVWDEVTHEALSVSRRWGQIALDAGWTSLNLFGCHTQPQCRRRDRNGLVQTIVNLLTPVRIIGLTSACAELADHNGSIMRFRPREKPGSVHLWEAYVMSGGP